MSDIKRVALGGKSWVQLATKSQASTPSATKANLKPGATEEPASRAPSARWPDHVLQKIQGFTYRPSKTRVEAIEGLVEALALTLGIILRVEEKDNKRSRVALSKKLKRIVGDRERKPRGVSAALLQVVKLCFPEKKPSDHTQYVGFVAYCLANEWKPKEVLSRFRKLDPKLKGIKKLSKKVRKSDIYTLTLPRLTKTLAKSSKSSDASA